MNFNNYNFGSLITRSTVRLQKKEDEPKFIKNYIKEFNKYVQSLKQNNPNLTLEELKNIIEQDYFDILDTIFNNGSSLDYSMAYESSIYLSSHKEKFNLLLKDVIDNPENIPIHYSSDFNNNLKLFISELKEEYDEFLSDEFFEQPSMVALREKLLDENITSTEKNKTCNYYYSKLDFNTKKHVKKYVDTIKNGEFGYLQHEFKKREEDLKDNLVLSISSVGKQLEKLGFLEKYPNYQAKVYQRLGLSNFSHSLKSSKNVLGLDRLSNPNYLAGLPLDTLLALNNFWCNRFIKEADTYFESKYTIEQLNLLPKMLDGSFEPDDLSIEDVKNVFLKMNFFYVPTKKYWSYASQLDDTAPEVIRVEGKNYNFLSNEQLINGLKECTEEDYQEYFNELLPSNNFDQDLDSYWKLYTPIINGYSFKDTSFLSTLALTKTLDLSFNYGIVIDENFPSSYENNIFYQVNFWIDYKGLNFPLREHIPLITLKNFLKEYNGDCMVPLYVGTEAFSSVPSHILFPFNKNQTSIIKNAKKTNYTDFSNDSKSINLLKHSSFLLNPKSAKKDVDKIFINLDDLNFYRKDDNNNYIRFESPPPREDSDQVLIPE